MPFKINFAYDNMMSTFIRNTITLVILSYDATWWCTVSPQHQREFYFLNLMGLSVYQQFYHHCLLNASVLSVSTQSLLHFVATTATNDIITSTTVTYRVKNRRCHSNHLVPQFQIGYYYSSCYC